MLGIIVATLVAGFVMFPSDQAERDALLGRLGTTNHGTLLQPALPVDGLPLRDDKGNPWRWTEHKPKWRLLIPAGRECDEECRELLYVSRQVHLLLGKYTGRFERVYINLEDSLDVATAQYLEQEHHYAKVLAADRAAFDTWTEDSNLPWGQGTMPAILVDPAGLAMMFYTVDIAGNDMLEDINHLLRYSPE
jgi:hypothetical protein